MGWYLAIKRNEIPIHATTRMNLENISDQYQDGAYAIIYLMCLTPIYVVQEWLAKSSYIMSHIAKT